MHAIMRIGCVWSGLTILFLNLNSPSNLSANETEIPGYTEAIKIVEVASKESGLLQKLNVQPGDVVEKGSLLGQLDDEVQKAQLEIANHLFTSSGELSKAEAELKTKEMILDHFQRLSADGFAQEKEILRAQMEVETAKANVLSRREKNAEYKIRAKLAQLQLVRREIRSPISGTVMEVHRSVGEFVSITQPRIVTIVQTSSVRGKFQIRLADLSNFRVGDAATVKVAGATYQGEVESIGLAAMSETVSVCISIQNRDGKVKFGQKCSLIVPAGQFTSTEEE